MSTPGFPGYAPTLLVGRDRELGVLRQHLHAALDGQGSLVLIGGEAGIGKTALAQALCREATQQGVLVLTGRSFDRAETPAYGPWLYLFERYAAMPDLPPLPAAFSVPGQVGAVASLSALFRQVVDFLKAVAAHCPMIVLLDDAHWADPTSLDLLRFLAQSVATLPLLVLVLYRRDELTRTHSLYQLLPLLVREAQADRLDLHALSDAALQTLVRHRYQLAEQDTARLVAHLQARAAGNALFVRELLRSLEELGVLRRNDEGWRLDVLTHTAVPPLVRQVIDGRLNRLDGESQRLLGVAAVIGQEVPLALWAATTAQDEHMLLTVVEHGVRSGLLIEAPDGDRIQFAHALVREAVFEGVPATRRRGLHRTVAEVLAASPNADPDGVAYQFQQAGDARAVAWLVKAGERAYRGYAWLTAALRYEAALAIMEREGAPAAERGWLRYRLTWLRWAVDPMQNVRALDDVLRLAEHAGDRALAAIARTQRGHYRVAARRDTARGMAEQAAGAAAVEALTPADQARLAPELRAEYLDPPDLRYFQWTQMASLAFLGRFSEALTIGERGIALTPPITGAQGYWGLAMTYAMLGRTGEAGRTFAQARTFYQTVEDHHQVGWVVYYELLLDRLAYRAERVAERRRLADEGEEAWRQASGVQADVPPRWPRLPLLLVEGDWAEAHTLAQAVRSATLAFQNEVALSVLGLVAWWQGEPDLAWTHVQEMFPDGPNTAPGGISFYEALTLQRVGAALALDAGNVANAHAWLVAHTRYLDWSGAVLCRAEGHLAWAAYYRAIDDRERAAEEATAALALAGDPHQPLALIAAHRLCGELDTAAGRHTTATAHLDAALTLAAACAAPYERALTLLALAELRHVTGNTVDALAFLDEVRAICLPLGAKAALMRLKTLAARLAAANDAPPTYPAGLSSREVEVLRLIAAGQTNREIAATLSISVKTVLNHVTHILTKTNLPNRAAAVAFAHQHDLVSRQEVPPIRPRHDALDD